MFKNSVFKDHVDTLEWFKAAGIRAVKTMAETALALIPAMSTLSQVDWKTVCSTAVVSGFISLLWSIKGIPEVGGDSDGE